MLVTINLQIKKDIPHMSCSLVSAPPTLNTVTATHAIQPTISIIENAYNVKWIFTIYYSF